MIVERADSRKYPKKHKMEDIDKEAERIMKEMECVILNEKGQSFIVSPRVNVLKIYEDIEVKKAISLALKSGIRIGEEKNAEREKGRKSIK